MRRRRSDAHQRCGQRRLASPLIAQACAQASAKDPSAQAIIAADQNVKHGDVISVIDLIRSNGLVRFAINVKQSDIIDGSGG